MISFAPFCTFLTSSFLLCFFVFFFLGGDMGCLRWTHNGGKFKISWKMMKDAHALKKLIAWRFSRYIIHFNTLVCRNTILIYVIMTGIYS